VIADGDQFTIGDSLLSVTGISQIDSHRPSGVGTVPFTRSPRVDVQYVGLELEAPDPPEPARTQRIPIAPALVPLLVGGLVFALRPQAGGYAVAFMLLSPLMILSNYFEGRRVARRAFREDVEIFEQNLADLVSQLRVGHDEEQKVRRQEHPSAAEVVEAVRDLTPLMWTRRPEHARFLAIRLGLGAQPSRSTIDIPSSRRSPIEFRRQLDAALEPFQIVDDVPIVCHLPTGGALGVAGPSPVRSGIAAGIVTQLVGLHSPAEVAFVGLASSRSAGPWDWLKWLPHVASELHPIEGTRLASTAVECTNLIGALTDLIGSRRSGDAAPGAHVVVLVEDDAPVDRSAIVQLAESCEGAGVHFIWLSHHMAGLPAVCRTFVELEPSASGAATGKVTDMERVQPVVVEALEQAGVDWLGRQIAPIVDDGIAAADESDVPVAVSLIAEVGTGLLESPAAVIERWTESNSLMQSRRPGTPSKRDNTLRALVGRTGSEALFLDLRAQGPHALVGGTTGAGKSEFLQTWITSMAATHSPQRINFLFVDYKGGAAFADCVSLPHAVGLVTDLSPHLVQRALVSLNAELRRREHVLNQKRAKDLLELERRRDPETPPSLVIVVDEFAALIQEVPEFVDGVVNIAQRGRSLGLHLVLATQRPAGVIKGNLRANTNLRVALRMADADDSMDVIGTPQAADFDPGLPGRGVAKTGPGRLSLFQAAYVGGVTSGNGPESSVVVRDLRFGTGREWVAESDSTSADRTDDNLATDITRIVTTIRAADDLLGLEPARRPWLPELAGLYDLAVLPTRRVDSELVFGVLDEPDRQSQSTAAFHPDAAGSMVVFGTGGAGKSTALRSIAVAAGLSVRGGPCQVYALDFGSRGLAMLEVLPHVGSVIRGDDEERIGRLLRTLRREMDDRAERYSALNAGSIDEYRQLSGRSEEPRLLVLLDGYPAFRSGFEIGPTSWMVDALHALAADGRPLGIHLVLTADRPGSVPASLASSIQKRLVMRQASDADAAAIEGVPRGGFGENSPPGRAFLEGREVQVAIFGGVAEPTGQAHALALLADAFRRAGTMEAPAVASLPDRIDIGDLPPTHEDLAVIGLSDETLGPFGLDRSTSLLVTGPPGSGRSTALTTIAEALRRADPATELIYLGQLRSPVLTGVAWTQSAVGAAAVAELASSLAEGLRTSEEPRAPMAVIVDGISDFLSTEADMPLQDLLKACRSAGVFVVAEGPTGEVGGSWPLLQLVKGSRHGIILQPDQLDGDVLFKTPFPRVKRADFPVGRGLYVRQGTTVRIQVAVT
jgi:S-DNA-T family DNA segregation ATPase FtsK/SpoIIIE